MRKAAFLGRFQPLHKGHKKVIEEYKEEYDLVIVMGSAGESRTEENPLTAEEREELIRECFPDINIVHLEDRENDKDWIAEMEDRTDADILISQNDRVKQIAESYSDMDVEKQEMYDPEIYSGNEARRRIKSGEEWRYLVPRCCKKRMEDLTDKIKDSGQSYEFEPGWKRENVQD